MTEVRVGPSRSESATERLRELLDERGADYGYYDGTVHWKGKKHGHAARLNDRDTLTVTSYSLTPEQAIEATLGRGTCKDVGRYCFRCSACDWCSNEPRFIFGAGFWANYCPNCGREVVE